MIPANKIPKTDIIWKYSNPMQAQRLASKYFGKTIYRATRKNKKYMIQNKEGKWVNFGQIPYEDYTKHKNKSRRHNYLVRTANMRGDWKTKKFSASNLSRKILW